MLDKEFLNGLMANEDMSVDDKVKQILAEHEADTRGLVQKRDELLGHEVKLKEQIAGYEKSKAESDAKVRGLEKELEKATSEDHKEYYEAQLESERKKHSDELQALMADRDFYKQSHLKSMRDKAIEAGIRDLSFVDGLKEGFVARVLSMNEFEPQEIDGSVKFLNKEHHTIEEAINSFALTTEGKAYIRNPSTGGGARGSGGSTEFAGGKQVNADQLANMSDEQIMKFALDGGKVI